MKHSVVCFLFSLFIATAGMAISPVNTTKKGNAIEGYDPVAYFTESRPVKGSEQHVVIWNGSKWLFASKENRARFEAKPEAFAPQFGGYCAWAVSQGYTAGIDPQAWKIVNGKLYLNYNSKVQAKWEKDEATLIAKGNENWPKVLEK